jgi:hypothetical protein
MNEDQDATAGHRMQGLPLRLLYLVTAAAWAYGVTRFMAPLEGGRDTQRYLLSMYPASAALVLAALTAPVGWGRQMRWLALLAIAVAFAASGFMAVVFLAYVLAALIGQGEGHGWWFVGAIGALALATIALLSEVYCAKPPGPQVIGHRPPA